GVDDSRTMREPGDTLPGASHFEDESEHHDGEKVFVVVDGRLSPRAVEVVVRSGADVLVRGALAPEDRVVTTRFPEIGPGVRVTVP
ncbi:MAG: hypothetical protein V3R88_06175, partial [Alphaproteobacteria bacterium]